MNNSESSEEEEEFSLEYWNDWRSQTHQYNVNKNNLKKKKVKNIVFGCNVMSTPVRAIRENVSFGNWIPPLNFSHKHLDSVSMAEQESKKKGETTKIGDENIVSSAMIPEFTVKSNKFFGALKWRKILNSDWGKRVELHDVNGITDGNLLWGMVSLGLFVHIKLWVNEYGNICGSADGTISKIGSSEKTLISISDVQLLRKMLNISSPQWALLCDVVQQTKASLKFEALNNSDMSEKNSLEKLWFFLCKRRHFSLGQCMLVKICGAVKCLREFKITPKLIVQDIRSAEGHPIL